MVCKVISSLCFTTFQMLAHFVIKYQKSDIWCYYHRWHQKTVLSIKKLSNHSGRFRFKLSKIFSLKLRFYHWWQNWIIFLKMDSLHSFFKKIAAKYPSLDNHSLPVVLSKSKGDDSQKKQSVKFKIQWLSYLIQPLKFINKYQKYFIHTTILLHRLLLKRSALILLLDNKTALIVLRD